jgi:hypothetical protein
MNTKLRLLLCAAALSVPAWLVASDVDGPAKGHVLVLENDRVMEGEIERVGDQYCVRRHVGETWVPADQVYCLCADYKEAYGRLAGRANLRDPDERVRLALWCQLHNLRQEALDELTAALALQPNNRDANRLFQSLQRSAATPARSVRAQSPDPEPSGPGIEVDSTSLAAFTTHVQPILINACARCHNGDKGGSFKLARTFEDPTLNHRATHQNLAAAVNQINRDHLLASPLLVRAINVHGGSDQPPLKGGRQSVAYASLEAWIRLTVTTTPADGEDTAAAPIQDSRPHAAPAVKETETAAAKPAAKETETTVVKPPPSTTRSAFATNRPEAAPAALDPFDPAIFNRQMHPERTQDEPKDK